MNSLITIAILIGVATMANGLVNGNCSIYYEPAEKISYSAGSLGGFFNLAKDFINAVQNDDIPYDKLQELKDYTDDGNVSPKELMKKVNPILAYEAGFIALLIIGILYCVSMPIAGSIFCCCRCCGHCGGNQKQEKPSSSYCFAYVGVLIAIFAFVLTGCLLFGLNNDKAWKEVHHA